MDFKKIADQAKSAIDDRGGAEGLKEDLSELKDIATGDGSIVDKAKEAVEAIKDPGEETSPAQTEQGRAQSGAAAPAGPHEGEAAKHGKHREHGEGHPRHGGR